MTDKQRFLDICNNEIKREGLDKLIDWLEKSDFFEAPASTKYHGNYAGGLLEHSLNVYDCLKRIVANIPKRIFPRNPSPSRRFSTTFVR